MTSFLDKIQKEFTKEETEDIQDEQEEKEETEEVQEEDDLTVITGIGAKTEEKLKSNNINTLEDLQFAINYDEEKLKNIIPNGHINKVKNSIKGE